jgi:hypothetical protein
MLAITVAPGKDPVTPDLMEPASVTRVIPVTAAASLHKKTRG